jgi:adenosylcobinamide-GDP ribazoletransferase
MFPDIVRGAIVLSLWVILTGALHLDGFLDSCDGIFGGNTPEKRLEIMRDERVGAFALEGGFLLLLIKFTSILALVGEERSLILAPMLGRWGITLAIISFPYAREQGLGREMKDHVSWVQVLLGAVVAIPVAWFLGGWDGLIAAGVVGVIVWGGSLFVLNRLPGLTGDIYGALCEVGEVGVLLTLISMNWIAS